MIRKTLKLLTILTFALTFLCFAALSYFNSERAKKEVTEFVETHLTDATGAKVKVGSFSFSLPLTLTLKDVSISETTSPWIEAERIRISISPIATLSKRLHITSIEVDHLNILDLPSTHYPEEKASKLPLDSFSLPFSLSIDKIAINKAVLSERFLTVLGAPSDHFSKGLKFNAAFYSNLNQPSLSATFSIGSAEAKIEALTTLNCSLKLQEDDVSLTFELKEPRAGLLARFINTPLPDKLKVKGHATSSLNALKALTTLDTLDQLKDVVTGSFSANIGKHVQTDADFSISGDTSLRLDIKNSHIGQLKTHGLLLLSDTLAFDGTNLHFFLSDFSDLDPPLPHPIMGELVGALTLTGGIGSLHAAIYMKASEISYETVYLKEMACHIEAHQMQEEWGGLTTLSTSLEGVPFKFSTNFNFKQDALLSLTHLSIDSDHFRSNGHLAYQLENENLSGEMQGFLEDLSFLSKWAPKPLNGSASFSFRLPKTQATAVELTAESNRFTYGDWTLKEASFNGYLEDIFKDRKGTIHSSITEAKKQGVLLNDLNLVTTIDPENQEWPFILSLGVIADNISLEAKGHWHAKERDFHFTAEHFEGKIQETPLQLNLPLTIKATSDFYEITPLSLALGEGCLEAIFDFKRQDSHSSAHFKNIPLKLFHLDSATLPVRGTVSGKASLQGTLETPTANCELSFHEVRVDEKAFADFPEVNGQFQLSLNKEGLNCLGKITSEGFVPWELESHLPITFSLMPLAIKIDKQAPIKGHLKAAGDLTPLVQLLFTDTTTFTGTMETSINLSGTLDSPQTGGFATLSDGSFESLSTGTVIKNIHASFEGLGSEIALKSLSAVDVSGGSLSGSGTLSLDASKQFPFSAKIDCNHLSLVEQDFINASFSGPLAIEGNSQGALVTGSLLANSATITIPEQPAPLVNSVEVTYINQSEAEKFLELKPEESWPLTLNIKVNAPEKVAIRGRDLTSEWKGSLTLEGLIDALQFIGDFKLVSGQYFFNGKDFDITEGLISLNGDVTDKSKTSLYIIASKDLGKLKAEVIIKGPLKNTEISFRSNPPLPQREILSWILFNRGTSEISPFQGSQLSESVTNLKTDNKGPDILTRARNALGIDRLDISRDEANNNAVSLQVGKYVSKNVFVSVNKSTVNRVAVEATLLPNIKLQAQVGDDSEGQLILKWKHDY